MEWDVEWSIRILIYFVELVNRRTIGEDGLRYLICDMCAKLLLD